MSHDATDTTTKTTAETTFEKMHPTRITPPPADGTGHREWREEHERERTYLDGLRPAGHEPTWADLLRLHTTAALAAGDTESLREELLDLAGLILGWMEDLDNRATDPIVQRTPSSEPAPHVPGGTS